MTNKKLEMNLGDYVILPGRCHDDYEYPDTLVGTRIEKIDSWSEAQLRLG